jgi:nicotinamide-nucleotide amidase
MNAIILSIGDELILGQTVDTNSAWLSQQLAAVGVPILAHLTAPDDQKAIEQAIRESATRCNYLIVSGGIGPTEDDLTRQALAAVMNAPLEENAEWMNELHKFFEARGRSMPPINRIQAMIPRGAVMIFNTCGTAAGIFGALGTKQWNCDVYVIPGVPKEMKAMFTRYILPRIEKLSGGTVILSRTLHTFGLGESALAERLGDLMHRDRNPSVGTTVTGGVVSLRINARFSSLAEAQHELEITESACRSALGDLIFGADLQTLPEAVADLLKTDPVALKRAPSVSTAESCTGGLVAKMLTDVPGSSAYFRQGCVTYSNEAKTNLLSVPAELIEQNGAVSEPVVRAMAIGSQQHSGAAYALAITGVAGPGGGTPAKPVGSVWIALAHPQGCDARLFLFPGDREMIRDRAAKMALTLLRFHLLGKPVPF